MRALVALGGAAGAVSRTGVAVLLPWSGAWSTLLANLTGAFALGVLVHGSASPRSRALLGTGFLGAWTTFSAVTLPDLPNSAGLHVGAGYVVATVLLGLAAYRTGRRLAARREGTA